LRLGASTNAAVVIHRVDGKKLKITKVEPSSPLINHTGRAIDQFSRCVLLVEVNAGALPRYLSEQIRISLTTPLARPWLCL